MADFLRLKNEELIALEYKMYFTCSALPRELFTYENGACRIDTLILYLEELSKTATTDEVEALKEFCKSPVRFVLTHGLKRCYALRTGSDLPTTMYLINLQTKINTGGQCMLLSFVEPF